jgi:hypothetical protein
MGKWSRIWKAAKVAIVVGMAIGKTKPGEKDKVNEIIKGIDKVIAAAGNK